MQEQSESKLWSTALAMTLAALIISLLCVWSLDRWYHDQVLEEEQDQASRALTPYGHALNIAVNQRLALLKGLEAFARTHSGKPTLEPLFEPFASGLASGKHGIRALQLFRPGKNLLVYPRKSNEAVLGRKLEDLLNDDRPHVRVDVQRATTSGKTTLSGPYELRQGGLGLVARKPIFIGETLWGMAVIILDVPPILQEAGISESNGQLNLALSNNEGEVFFGLTETFLEHAATYPIMLPDRPWLLSATPIADSQKSGINALVLFRTGLLSIVLLITIITYTITSGQARLKKTVEKRTRALADSRNRYGSLIEKMSNGFALHEVITDDGGIPKDYRFIEVNQAFEEMTGLSRFRVIGKTVLEAIPSTERFWIERFATVALTGEPQHFTDYSAELGKHYEVTAYCPEAGQFATIINDVSERKNAVDKIQRLNAELEDRVKQRTAELERSNRELEAFSYSISHDLRAPLRAINGYAFLLEEALPEAVPEKTRSQLTAIQANSRRMGQLIDDLLAYTRLSKGLAMFSPVDLCDVMASGWKEVSRTADDRTVDFRLQALPPCLGDASLLKQMAINLLDNAMKFTSLRKQSVIEVGSETENDQVVYFVKDNGVGFDMRYAHKMFGVFNRLHSGEDFEGTGIGLPLAKRIIERHGGKIWAEGRPGEGATFFFTVGHDESATS